MGIAAANGAAGERRRAEKAELHGNGRDDEVSFGEVPVLGAVMRPLEPEMVLGEP